MRKKDAISGKTRESLTRSTPKTTKTPKTTTTVGMQDVKSLTNAPNNNRDIILGRGSGRRRCTSTSWLIMQEARALISAWKCNFTPLKEIT